MSSRVYIGGLPERAGARDIEKLFEKYGRVRGINVKSGFAFIEYEDGRDADDAVYDLDGKPFMGERRVHEYPNSRRISFKRHREFET